MVEITIADHIEAPPERVFEVFADVQGSEERISGITKVVMLTEGPVGVGTRWRETREMFKREATEELVITAFDPPEGYTVGCDSHGAEYRSEFRFEPEGSGTKVTVVMRARAVSFAAKLMAPLGKLMAGTMRKCIQKDVDELKELLEAERASAAASS